VITAILMSPSAIAAPVAESPAPPFVRLRKNIANLTTTELQGLRDAVAAMKALPSSDVRSWEAQAQIHNNFCPHGNLQFLPWHRKYLYYFEKILLSMSGGKLKALPYWDYTNTTQAEIPASFTAVTYGAGIPNPLYHANRSAFYNTSANALPSFLMDPTDAMDQLAFNGFSFSLEGQPHNNVHTEINGTMGGFLSPRDPIFWLHHCNIDRLWERWLALGGGRSNPVDATWLNANYLNTQFFDEAGNPHQLKNSDVLNIVGQLDYTYSIIWRPLPIYYEWRRLWRWEILRPWPFEFVNGPWTTPIREFPVEEVRRLERIQMTDMARVNAVLVFEVDSGMSTVGSFDLIASGRGRKATKVKTFSLFGMRHSREQGHMAGMSKHTINMVLDREETRRLAAMLRSRQVSFTVRRTRGSANNAKIAPDPKVKMNLTAIEFFQPVRVRRVNR
jgi:hypothetical protein